MRNTYAKWAILMLLIASAYGTAWFKAYQLSYQYFQYANAQLAQGHLISALKGMNKLELRQGETYFGGYQQVIETWEDTLIGPKPWFYSLALHQPRNIISQLNAEQLEVFIQVYVELDVRYVPEVAEQLQLVARQSGDTSLAREMVEFLSEAFPYYQIKSESD